MTERWQQNYCVKCGALESEPAREECKNPAWHEPAPVVREEGDDGVD